MHKFNKSWFIYKVNGGNKTDIQSIGLESLFHGLPPTPCLSIQDKLRFI